MFEISGDLADRSGDPIDNSPASCIIGTNARERQVQAPSARAKDSSPPELRRRNLKPDFTGNPKSESIAMQTDTVRLPQIWRETTRFLDTIHGEVREGKSVMEWSRFTRWLRFSGILEILEAHPQDFPHEVNGKALRAKVEDLLSDCGEKFRTGKADPTYTASDIAEINRKLDIIAHRVATISPPAIKTPESGAAVELAPELRVIEGGVK